MMKLRYLGTVVALVTLGMTAPASAEQSEAEIARIKTTNECFQGFQDKNYEVALTACQKAADNGKLEAVNLLGAMYENGWGTQKDPVKAADYYKSAANAGLPDAMVNLGTMYEKGIGVEADLIEAQFYYGKAARAGNEQAATNIANLYLRGKTTDLPESEVMGYLQKASDAGNGDAASRLATLLIKNGDYEAAAVQLEKASDKADPKATYDLANLYKEGKIKSTDPGIAERLLKTAADRNYVPAMADYGIMLALNKPVEAIPYLEEAAKNGRPECVEELAFIYLDGRGVQQQTEKGLQLLKASAEKKDANATRLLGNIYYDGEYVEKDLKKAFNMYKTAAGLADASAQNSYAEMLLKGEGIDSPDVGYAIKWFEAAAEKGNIDALKNLGEIYYTDDYGRKDRDKSMAYFMKARDLGDTDAGIIVMQRDFRNDSK